MGIRRVAQRSIEKHIPTRRKSRNLELAFDNAWYAKRYPEVQGDLLDHYLTTGWRTGHDPCSLFDTSWYLEQNRDVVDTGINPFAHYVDFGWAEGRDPSPVFNTNWYLHYFPGRGTWSPDPMTHFRLGGWESGRGPHPLFDLDWYLTQMAQRALPKCDGDPLTHFLEMGWRHNLDPNPLFDCEWYRSAHPDLDSVGLDPLTHYVLRGAAAGDDPSAMFNTAAYAARNPQCGGRAGALAHYLEFGRAEGVALPGSQSPAASPIPDLAVTVTGSFDRLSSCPSLAVVAGHDDRRIIGAATRHLCSALREAGFFVILSYDHDVTDNEAAHPWDVVVSADHAGYDFFSWRLALEAIPEQADIGEIVVMNDSVIGPISDFTGTMAAWRALPFAVTGLLESTDPRPHIQSWAVRFSGAASTLTTVLGFYGKARAQTRKGDLIDFLEVPLAEHFRSQGHSVGSLFSHVNVSSPDRNPAIFGYRELLAAGCPFVKREAFSLPAAITWTPQSQILDDVIAAATPGVAVRALVDESLAQISR
jgi:hypothetical protein